MYHTNVQPKWPWLNQAMWDDLRCPLANVPGGGTSPAWGKFLDDGAGSTGVYSWLFNNVGTPDLAFALQIPHTYKLGTNVRAHVHAAPVDANAGKIRFGLEYTHADQDTGTFPVTQTVYVTVDAAGVAYRHQFMDFGELAVSFANVSGMFLGRLFRDNTVGGNYGSQVAGLEFDLHYRVDTMGSRVEKVK